MYLFVRFICFACLVLFSCGVSGQGLKPGFDKAEFTELLKVSSAQGDSIDTNGPNYIGDPKDYERIYRSEVIGLQNRWDLWKSRAGNSLVISLRGTTATADSWLENFYSAMVPAQGRIQLNDSTFFDYKFADDPKAAVHAGWTVGIAYLAPDIMIKLKEHAKAGRLKDIYIIGHSQGGALAFLLNSYLRYKIKSGELPQGITIKTYSSASPKVGNLYYAYDYDFINRGGWAFNVVSAADWVPEMPFSIQTTSDFTDVNPFPGLPKALKMVKPFYLRWYLKHAYNKLDRSARNAQEDYTRMLGKTLFKMVQENLPSLTEPQYVPSMSYARAGTAIVLQPDEEYFTFYSKTEEKNIFLHHAMKPYLYLMEKQY